MNTTPKSHHPDKPPVEDNQVPGDRPLNPNPVVDGTHLQGVEYPDQPKEVPDGESAKGRAEAEAARRDQEKIGTPEAST